MNIKPNNKNLHFLQKSFKEYYFKNTDILECPHNISQREFGFMNFESDMIRHISFDDMGQLNAYLLQNVPSDIYYSNSYYEFPTFPMNEKRWIGADLIFDIDLKDLASPCLMQHTYFICKECGIVSQKLMKICDLCKSTKIHSIVIPCHTCINILKKETKKLISFLTEDFGIDSKYIFIYFSGNTGFHITAIDQKYFTLDSKARSDLAGYLMGKNISLGSLGARNIKDNLTVKLPQSGFSYGWRKKIINKLNLSSVSNDKLSKYIKKIGGYDEFKKEVENITKTIGVKIDPYVTMDIHRIFRMAGSINSKSGLSKVKCKNLDTFDPFSDASLFQENENIDINVKTKLKLIFKQKKYHFDNSSTTVPYPVAIYLVSKSLADVL